MIDQQIDQVSPPRPQGSLEAVVERERIVRLKRRQQRDRSRRFSAPMLAAILIVLWQVAVDAGLISAMLLPSPASILLRAYTDFPLIAQHAWITASEVLLGFAIAAVSGIGTAIAIFYSKFFRHAVYPLLVGLQTVPKVALAPLLVLYLGYGWSPKLFLAALLAFFPIVVSTVVGLESVDAGLIRMISSMGASSTQIFFKVRLPVALPNIFAGLKVGIGLAVIGAILGEYVAAQRGLGYLQLQANANFDTTLNMAVVVVIALIGIVFYSALAAWEALVITTRKDRA